MATSTINKNKLLILICATTCILSGITYKRNGTWQTEITLWEDVVSKSNQKARDHYTLGKAYHLQGSTGKAMEHYLIAVTIKPDYANALTGLGRAFKDHGLFYEAIAYHQRVLELKPDSHEAHVDIGNCYDAIGLPDKAIDHYKAALQLAPDYPLAHYNIGITYERQGMIGEATSHFTSALELDPGLIEAYRKRPQLSYDR